MAQYEPGTYMMLIKQQGLGEIKNDNRTPYFEIQGLIVCAVERDGTQVTCNESERSIKLHITDGTIKYVRNKLEYNGFPVDGKLSTLDPESRDHHSFVGKEIKVFCKHKNGVDKDSGRPRVFEDWDLSWGGGQAKPIERVQGVGSKLDSMFGGKKSNKPPVRQQTTTQAANATPDDDIPF